MNTDFDELLRDGMERFTADLHAPVNLADRARRSRRQRMTTRTAASCVAAAAVTAIAFAALPSTAPVTTGIGHPAVPEGLDVEYLHVNRTAQKSIEQFWSYRHEVRELISSTSGRRLAEGGSVRIKPKNGHKQALDTIVDFRHKTWARGPQDVSSGLPLPSCHPPFLDYPMSPSALPAWIGAMHKLIKCGDLKVSGTAEIDGVETIKLTTTSSLEAGPGSKGAIWVKRADFVPVRMIVGKGANSWRADLHWLRPTKANQALLRVPIPHGFRRVPLSKIDTSSGESCTVSSAHPHKQVCTHSG
ncbi:MAG TPA: hypothetical protein VFI65_32775 [Streptosporangiaceae bacterium]|nr:hypothetical protein [Streptosporangiaceae bacterium]